MARRKDSPQKATMREMMETALDTMAVLFLFFYSILILTSNVGSKESSTIGFAKDESLRRDNALKDIFSPEFRGRLDSIIQFNPLGKNEFKLIAKKIINDLNADLAKRKIKLTLNSRALNQIASHCFESALGAREIKKLIDSEIKTKLSDLIIEGKLDNGGEILIKYSSKGFTLTQKS